MGTIDGTNYRPSSLVQLPSKVAAGLRLLPLPNSCLGKQTKTRKHWDRGPKADRTAAALYLLEHLPGI